MTGANRAWLEQQRWYAGKGSEDDPAVVSTARIGDDVTITLVDVGGDRYQLVSDGRAPDTLDDPATGQALLGALDRGTAVDGPGGRLSFHLVQSAAMAEAPVRPVGVEQSNTSLVVGDEWILKVLRRVPDGVNPELEVLRFLADRGAPHVPRLAGWYQVDDGQETRALGVLAALVPDAIDGWSWLLERLPWQPEATIRPLHQLGTVLAELHGALASGDPADGFGTVEGGRSMASSSAEGIRSDSLRIADTLAPDQHEARAALTEAAARAQRIATDLDAGSAIRVHGDLHLGQVLMSPAGWTVIDWEGEPSRPVAERRAHQPALRDLAGLLRSLSYAAATASRSTAVRPLHGWLAAARAAVLDGYFDAVDPSLLPSSAVDSRRLLDLLELEKLVYEIGYEAANRPTWIGIPLSGLRDTLRSDVA